LDACRGLALWFVFLDHVLGNSFAWLTLRNYGFSDTSEVSVFVSGCTCMLAYGSARREQGWSTTVARALGCDAVPLRPALSDGAPVQLVSAGVAQRRALFQSACLAGVAITVAAATLLTRESQLDRWGPRLF